MMNGILSIVLVTFTHNSERSSNVHVIFPQSIQSATTVQHDGIIHTLMNMSVRYMSSFFLNPLVIEFCIDGLSSG